MQLAEYLSERNITVRDFAAKLGVTDEAVRLWTKGLRRPRQEQLDAIRKETGGRVTPNDFFNGSEAA